MGKGEEFGEQAGKSCELESASCKSQFGTLCLSTFTPSAPSSEFGDSDDVRARLSTGLIESVFLQSYPESLKYLISTA